MSRLAPRRTRRSGYTYAAVSDTPRDDATPSVDLEPAVESAGLKKQVLSIRPGAPLILAPTEGDTEDVPPISADAQARVGRLGTTLKVYLTTARTLVEGRYAELRDYVPQHM